MSYNQTAQCIEDIAEELSLLASLASHPLGRDKLVSSNIPITLITLLRSEKTLLIKYPSATLKHLISIFQNTCVGSACAGRLSEIVIDMLLSLS